MDINSFVNILLVEDNEGDIELTREAFEDGKVLNNLVAVQTAEAALDILEKKMVRKKQLHQTLFYLI